MSKTIPARFLDIANLIMSMAGAYVPEIHMIIDFEGRLDVMRLKRTFRLSFDAEPVLGCRFVMKPRPCWKRLSDDCLNRPDILAVNTIPMENFLASVMNEQEGPQVRALLLQNENGDRLVIKINHMVADASGTKDFAYLISAIYRELEFNPDFKPSPNIGSRGLNQLFNRFSIFRLLSTLPGFLIENVTNFFPPDNLSHPSGNKKADRCTFVCKKIPEQTVMKLKESGQKKDFTINDVIVTAIIRAAARQIVWDGKTILRMVGTVDLRRYMPDKKAEAICNLSSFYFPHPGKKLGKNFSDTLNTVKRKIDTLKSLYPGLGYVYWNYMCYRILGFRMIHFITKKIIAYMRKTGRFPIALTNMGLIDETLLNFGPVKIISAELVTPAGYPMFPAHGLSGFKSTLTLSAGFFESSISRDTIEEFFALTMQEIDMFLEKI